MSLIANFGLATTSNAIFQGTNPNDAVLYTTSSNNAMWIGCGVNNSNASACISSSGFAVNNMVASNLFSSNLAYGAISLYSGAANVSLNAGPANQGFSNVTCVTLSNTGGAVFGSNVTFSNLIVTGKVTGFNGVNSNQSFSNVYSSNITASNVSFSNVTVSSLLTANGGISAVGQTITSANLTNTGVFSNTGNALFGSLVGVGTLTPSYPLDVVGNARISGIVLPGGTLQNPFVSSGYAYALYTTTANQSVSNTGNINAKPMTGSFNSTNVNGITLSGNTINVPSGLYAITLVYNLSYGGGSTNSGICVFLDGSSSWCGGQYVTTASPAANICGPVTYGSTTFISYISSYLQICGDSYTGIWTAPSQYLTIRRIL